MIELPLPDDLTDHHPEIGSSIDDSCWLTCWCGWDAEDSKLGWWEHIEAAITLKQAADE